MLVVRAAESVTPVPCRGRYLIRVGTVNREMAPDGIGRNLMEKLGETWDALRSDSRPTDIDRDAVREFLELAKPRLRSAKRSDPPERVLENLELIRDGRLTKGGSLLFGNHPQRASAHAVTHIGRFKGEMIEDDRMVEQNLWRQLDAAMDAFHTYLQKRVEVHVTELTLKGLQNKQTWEYPLDALREAVINALIHRDYTALGNVEVRVREDSITVWSPGGLPRGTTLEELRKRHASNPRNPLLARAFFLAGHIERWGTGTNKMIRLCREQELPDPEYTERQGGFLVTFQKDTLTPERLKTAGLNERQIKAMLHLRVAGVTVSNKEYATLSGASLRTGNLDLADLLRRGLLDRTGAGRAIRYRATIAQIAQPSRNKPAERVDTRKRAKFGRGGREGNKK